MKNKLLLPSFTILALIVSACASGTPLPPTATLAPVVSAISQPTVAPAAALPSGPAAVDVGQNADLGSFLVDFQGIDLVYIHQ